MLQCCFEKKRWLATKGKESEIQRRWLVYLSILTCCFWSRKHCHCCPGEAVRKRQVSWLVTVRPPFPSAVERTVGMIGRTWMLLTVARQFVIHTRFPINALVKCNLFRLIKNTERTCWGKITLFPGINDFVRPPQALFPERCSWRNRVISGRSSRLQGAQA